MRGEVLVDSSIWSLAFRRRRAQDQSEAGREMQRLVLADRVRLIGPIRQEVLSGIAQITQYQRVISYLSPFPNERVLDGDYLQAAFCYNRCRERGVQGSHIDFLICAVALRLDLSVFTTDRDFTRYQPILGFRLHEVGR